MRGLMPLITLTVALVPFGLSAQGGGGGSADLRVSGQFISDEPTGEPPLQVQSTTSVPNLSADKLDGFDAGDFATPGSGVGVHYENLVGIPGKEIDQACAAGAGCFSGDGAGFPVVITEPGSYRLASNLDITGEANAENVNVIEVAADNVTIDLAGFAIIGPTACTGSPVTSCTPVGTGFGIDFVAGGDSALGVVRNGVIRGMGENGIRSDVSLTVHNVRVSEAGAVGILVFNGSARIADSMIFRNGDEGLFGAMQVTDSVVQGNATTGIYLNPGGVARDNQVVGNGGDGMRCAGCQLLDNQVSDNVGHGLDLDGSASYGGNMIYNNGAGHIDASGTNHEVRTNTCGTGAAGTFAC